MAIELMSWTTLTVATLLLLAHLACVAIYRVFFHPLARFPGPKYAALSRWHECYYDVYQKGKLIFWIEDQHKRYGPIVRITPDELHIQDADFWETLFTRAGRQDKYDWMSGRFGNDTSVLTTASESLHRVRRQALNPFFSRQHIVDLQDIVCQKLSIFMNQIKSHSDSGNPVTISRGYMSFSEDVIMKCCFGYDYDSLRKQDWRPILHDSFTATSIAGNTALHFPLLPKIMNALPQAWIEKLDPLYAMIFRMQHDFGRQIREIKSALPHLMEVQKDNNSHRTIITDLLQSNLPEEQKADRRLQDEVQVIVGAGLSTTGWALSVGTYYLLTNPQVLARLREELDAVIPAYNPTSPNNSPTSDVGWTELEKLPYLTAVIKESVRLSYTTASRNVRLLSRPIEFGQWLIPARTPISMTIPFLNHDEEIFPESKRFMPERWLDAPKSGNGSSLDRYFVGFGKGTRSCLGVNLAWSELYLVFASMFRSFDFELYETDKTDVELTHDFFLPFPKLDSKGIRVYVKDRQ